MQKSSYSKPQLWHLFSPTSHLGTHCSCSYREKRAFTSEMGWGEERFLFEGTPGNGSGGDGVGLVAQRIRARGYEPRCRGFESLLAHNRSKREGPFPWVMIGVVDAKFWNLSMGLLSKRNGLFFFFNEAIITYSTPSPNQHICVLLPVTLPQPGLGRIAEQVQVLVA